MRVGSFVVTGENGGKADISIIPIMGPVGSEIDNVNRWRREIGLPPVTEGALGGVGQTVDVGPGKGRMFDLVSDQPKPGSQFKERTVVAVLTSSGATWYIKMRGDDPVVAGQKAVFTRFLKDLTFSDQSAPAAASVATTTPVAAGAASSTSADGLPNWKVPQGWVAEAPGSMVMAAFEVGGQGSQTKVMVSVFPGDVGGTFANINRWRGQMGLPPITEAELPQHTTTLDLGGTKAILADMRGKDARSGSPARMVAAIVPQGGRTWFYKLMGNEQIVEREKIAFVKFLSTARYPNDR